MASVVNNSIPLYPQIGASEKELISLNFHGDFDHRSRSASLRVSSPSLTSSVDFQIVQQSDTNFDSHHSLEHNSHQHSKAESSVELYRCKYCHFNTEIFEYFLEHGKNIHNQSFRKKFSCNKCPYSAAKRWKVIEHMTYHEKLPGITLCECQICPFKAPHKHQLDRHMMFIHQDERKQYKCNICYAELHSKTLLMKHRKIHK